MKRTYFLLQIGRHFCPILNKSAFALQIYIKAHNTNFQGSQLIVRGAEKSTDGHDEANRRFSWRMR